MKFYIHYESEGYPSFAYKVSLEEADEKVDTVGIVLERFVKAYNKAHSAQKELNADRLELRLSGKSLKDDSKISGSVENGADLFAVESDKLLRCGNTGCTKDYLDKDNHDTACQFHPGNPKFHEGNKGYDCCWNKRVISFDEFLNLPGCAFGRHKKFVKPIETPKAPSQKIDNTPIQLKKTENGDGKETYAPASAPKPKEAPKPWTPPVEVPDPADAVIPLGASCLHQGCSATYKDSSSREEKCVYHPGSPVFHEGSKGWQCCKVSTLIFEDFLNAPGCTEGRHKFVPEVKKVEKTIRRDFYQMGDFVYVNFYEKNVNKEGSTVTFEPQAIKLSLLCADGSRFEETISLTKVIDPDQSKFSILTPKVEVKLKKKGGGDWTKL